MRNEHAVLSSEAKKRSGMQMNDGTLKQQYDDARVARKRLEARIEAIDAMIHDATCEIDFSFRIVDA